MSNFETTIENSKGIKNLYRNWFLEYASYVILDRAVPVIEDGLKPVQRRILHAMKEMDDGKYNKVANIIGQSMQYHPHGDASIGDALVNMGQKNLLIDTQGNWGDVCTGDSAAAARYIEARLSKFALEVLYQPKITEWQLSYDGRKKEPVTLPAKFPIVLSQGVEGIAVGLSTKILPHNFIELCDASIQYLKGKKFQLLPDFITGGLMDATQYNYGKRGGKIKLRCVIREIDKKTLSICNVPYGVTTTQLIDSILSANDKGKIKIKKITDNTAAEVEIQVDVAQGITTDQTIDALYAFTDCEISISPNTCVIIDKKPCFIGVDELLTFSTENTKSLLQKELLIHLLELQEKWHYTSLEKIFFEEKIYQELEKKHNSWEVVLLAIKNAFIPFLKKLKKEITTEDILKLTEKPVRRIYKLDIDELDAQIKAIEKDIKETKYHLNNLVEYAIQWFEKLKIKYGKDRKRKTKIQEIETLEVRNIAIANVKLYANFEEGFLGTGLKKDQHIFDCSDVDDIVAFTKEGTMKVVKVSDKAFIGKNIIHIAVFKKNDIKTTYNMVYLDGATGTTMAKRFQVGGVTRDKQYILTKGTAKSKVLYFTSNPLGETEKIKFTLSPNCSAKNKEIELDFKSLEIKNRVSIGNQVTKYPVRTVKLIAKGKAQFGGQNLYFDATFNRLNTNNRGQYLGNFNTGDFLLLIYKDGNYEITEVDLNKYFYSNQLLHIQKFDSEEVITTIYWDNEKKQYYIKRFKIETSTIKTKFSFIKEGKGNYVQIATTQEYPTLQLNMGKKGMPLYIQANTNTWVEVMGWKAIGNKIPVDEKIAEMEWINL
ncbi:MAG: DNA gyrase/topoisomerase IV subunit A [Chitinophagaceae bacterium]